MKAFLLKYRSSLLLFAVMFLFGWGSAAVVAKWQSDRETEETMHIEAAVDNWGLGLASLERNCSRPEMPRRMS